MKSIKRKSLIMLLLVAIGIFTLAFGMVLSAEGQRKVHASSGTITASSNNIITATIAGNPIDTSLPDFAQVGTLSVEASSLRFNGIDRYDITDNSPLELTVAVGNHFEFATQATNIKMIVQRINSAGAITSVVQIDTDTHILTPEPGFDYQVIVNIIPIEYTVTLETYFVDNTRANISQTYFLANGQHTQTTVTWGSLNLQCRVRENTLNGDNFRVVRAEVQRNDSTRFNDVSLGNTLLNDNFLNNHVQSNGSIIIHGIYTRVVAINITTNITDANRTFEHSIQIDSTSRVAGQQRIDNGIGAFFFDIGSLVTISATNAGGFNFQQFVINGTPSPELGGRITQTNLTSNILNIRADFTVSTFNLFLVGIDHTGNPVDLGANARVTVTNASGIPTTFSANHAGNISVCPHSTLQFHHDANTLAARYSNPQYFIRGMHGAPDKEIGLNQTIQITDDFVNTFVADGQIFFTVSVERKFQLTVIPSSQLAGTILVNGEIHNPAQSNFFFEGDEIVLEATANNFHTFVRFDGMPAQFTFGNADITVHAIFAADLFRIHETGNFLLSGAQDGSTLVSIGMQLTISYTGDVNGGINRWTINGQNLAHFGAERTGRSVTLTIDEQFINRFIIDQPSWVTTDPTDATIIVLQLENSVSTSTNLGTVISIIIPAVIIPLALAILVLVLVKSKNQSTPGAPVKKDQRKKYIKHVEERE